MLPTTRACARYHIYVKLSAGDEHFVTMELHQLSEFSQVVLSLYEVAHTREMDEFQDVALGFIKRILPFDSAMWGTATMTDEGIDIHTLHLHNTSMQMIKDYQQIKHLDHFAHEVAKANKKTIQFSAAAARSEALHDFLLKYKHMHGLITQSLNPETRFVQWLSLFRHDAKHTCTEAEVMLLDNLFAHVMKSLAINRKLHMKYLVEDERRERWAVAIADHRGFFYHADETFLQLIAQDYVFEQADRLPEALMQLALHAKEPLMGEETLLISKLEGELLFLKIRPKVLADKLNIREFTIAKMLAEGLTAKDIANKLHRSPETVRTQSKTIYKKLGVNKATQISTLLLQRDWTFLKR